MLLFGTSNNTHHQQSRRHQHQAALEMPLSPSLPLPLSLHLPPLHLLVLLLLLSAWRPPPSAAQTSSNIRSSFHFQPQHNWMNDPNGMVVYGGLYHLFYQYNPYAPVWGNISWGHAVSPDLLNWVHLPLALEPDQWYDRHGVWSGATTTLQDGTPIISYTGSSDNDTQNVNLAYPANLSDPFLVRWVKARYNPIAMPPPGIDPKQFRDPTTAWLGPDGLWRMALGSKTLATAQQVERVDQVLVLLSENFTVWNLSAQPLDSTANRTGAWECPDLFPVSTVTDLGLDTNSFGGDSWAVLKGSFDDTRQDYYALGIYTISTTNSTTNTNTSSNSTSNNSSSSSSSSSNSSSSSSSSVASGGIWTPFQNGPDVPGGTLLDHGVFYASRTFYDQEKQRRILIGWVPELDSVAGNAAKGWASLQSIPREVVLDPNSRQQLLQAPVGEVELLRQGEPVHVSNLTLQPGTQQLLPGVSGSQADIVLDFNVSSLDPNSSAVGPFGVAVLATADMTEATLISIEKLQGATDLPTFVVSTNLSRSSLRQDVSKPLFNATVSMNPRENDQILTLRILVDNCIVETFAKGGKVAITARAYPTLAVASNATILLFNYGPQPVVLQRVDAWSMQPAQFTVYAAAAAGPNPEPKAARPRFSSRNPSLLLLSTFCLSLFCCRVLLR